MKQWLDSVAAALPVVFALATLIWVFIVFHGDSRWPKRTDVFGTDGEVKWAPKSTEALVLGQNDKIADHEKRLGKMEERSEVLLQSIHAKLDRLQEIADDMQPRLVRVEARAEND